MMTPIQSSHLYQEIHQQPEVIRNLIGTPQQAIKDLAAQIHSREIRQVVIAARGTSDNAARYAKYLLGAHNHLLVSLAAPSLFTLYNQPPDLTNTLILGISQSGKSPDIVSVLKEGSKQGALTAAMTNNPNSDLGNAADFVLALQAGEELSLAATKTYTAQLTCVALLSAALGSSPKLQQDLLDLPDQIERLFESESQVKTLVERYRYMTHCTIIGRGFNYASAFEFSLKLKELSYTIAEPYSGADFLHGPIALVDRGYPIFVLAPGSTMTEDTKTLIAKLKERQAEIIIFSDQEDLLAIADQKHALPGDVPEWLSPITTIVPAQMFAMYLTDTRGLNVDSPRGLHKVTETW